MLRKRSLSVFLVAVALTILSVVQVRAAEAIKIGFMAPYVGVYTKLGIDMDNGFKLYLDEVGWKAGGRTIKVIKSDTEGKPTLGPIKAKELVEKDRVQLLAGIVHSGVALAIRDYIIEKKIPLIITNAGAPELTATRKAPYIFRVSFTNGQLDLAGGWYAFNKLGIRKMAILAPDYSSGHDKANGFMKYFKESGGVVLKEIYPPLGTPDFGPYLAEIRNLGKNIDGTWAFFAGSDAIRFVTQYAEYGLNESAPLFVIGDTVDEAYLPSMGTAAVGAKLYTQYAVALDTPENKKFVEAYRRKYNEDPSMYSESAYVGARAIVEAINAVNGKVEDTAAFMAALKKVAFVAPRGPFRFDGDQNVIQNAYIAKVELVNGKPACVLTDVIPDVDQHWKPKEVR
jgi:branched-chain amino acid transport system substrate-binding protein